MQLLCKQFCFIRKLDKFPGWGWGQLHPETEVTEKKQGKEAFFPISSYQMTLEH